MQEKFLPKKEAENEASLMRYLTGDANVPREAYSAANFIVDITKEILPLAVEMPKIKNMTTWDKDKAIKNIAAILMRTFPKQLARISHRPDLVELIAEKIYFELITVYDTEVERVFEQDFLLDDIISKICEVDGWEPSELKIIEITKDAHNEVIMAAIRPVKEEESLIRFGRYVSYIFAYPFKEIKTGQFAEEFPVIDRWDDDSEASEIEEEIGNTAEEMANEELSEKFKGHRNIETIFEFEDGAWHKRTF